MMDEARKLQYQNNVRIGRLHYFQEVDEQGYPNGMPLWEELSPYQRYAHTAKGISLLEHAIQFDIVGRTSLFGFERDDRGHLLPNAVQDMKDAIEKDAEDDAVTLGIRARTGTGSESGSQDGSDSF